MLAVINDSGSGWEGQVSFKGRLWPLVSRSVAEFFSFPDTLSRHGLSLGGLIWGGLVLKGLKQEMAGF